MARIFLSTVCTINPALALCDVHWALWAIVELFHRYWENLDRFLLFVFILGNKHAGIFCRCASSTKKIPHSTRNQRSHKRRRWKHILKMPHCPFWNDGIDISCLHYQNHCMCSRELNCGVGWGFARSPAGFPGRPRQLLFLIFFDQEIPPSCHSHSPLVFYLEKFNCCCSVLWRMRSGHCI